MHWAKKHKHSKEDEITFMDKAVVVIRNPILSSLSEFNRLKGVGSDGHVRSATEDMFSTEGDHFYYL